MKHRRAVTVSLRSADQLEGRRKGMPYESGYQAGYALGLRLGQEDRGSVFEGTSIIIPADPDHDDIVPTIQRVEKMTPHPYEIIIADAGATAKARRYIYERRGALRHIQGQSGDQLAHVMNKAITAAFGDDIVILIDGALILDDWLGVLIREFERKPALKVVYASREMADSPEELWGNDKPALLAARSGFPINYLLFKRTLPDEIGLWPEGLRSVEEHTRQWLERISPEQRQRIEASAVFA